VPADERAGRRGRGTPGTLYLCPTPIGNLRDVTLRVLDVLRQVDLVLAEDTRRTRKLLQEYGIEVPLLSFHDANEERRLPRVLGLLEGGRSVALVADAGFPLMADPGYRLVREVIARDLPLTALPGPSAILPALALSGLPPYPYLFLGFLPRRSSERRRLLERVLALPWTVVAFEAPHRLVESLADAVAVVGPDRPAAVARELTKVFETVVRGTTGELLARFRAEPPRGELVLVIAGSPMKRKGGDDEVAPLRPTS